MQMTPLNRLNLTHALLLLFIATSSASFIGEKGSLRAIRSDHDLRSDYTI